MRSSRISRQTARVADALSQRTRPQQASGIQQDHTPETHSDASDLSTPPSSPDLPSRKRKLEAAPSTPPRRSTRKAPKLSTPNGSDRVAKKEKAPRQPAKRISGAKPPPNWQEVYALTAAMRARTPAPVDTLGCETLASPTSSPRDQRLQTLVALMLSSQTKDAVTAAAIRTLQAELPGGLSLESLLEVAPEELNRLIGKVGFHNRKTEYLKATAALLASNFSSDIPDTVEGLVSLPGVGPKMAYLTLSAAWGRDEGIGVDVHVHRITNLWGWHATKTPEETRGELESWLPRELWHGINHLLVGFGQTVCLPVGRRCGECDLSARGLCPSAVVGKRKVEKRGRRKVEVGIEGEVEKGHVMVERDDVAVKVEADVGGEGVVEVQAFAGAQGALETG